MIGLEIDHVTKPVELLPNVLKIQCVKEWAKLE
jgi:hypothetical protein